MSSHGAQTVLVIGSGGREHALAWKLARSPQVARIIVAPGNEGMPTEWERWKTDLSQGKPEFERLASRALEAGVALTVVGPDNPLADGMVDVFDARGLLVFGPTAAAARIEASKAFAKEVMQAAGVPTAKSFIVPTRDEARKLLKSLPWEGAGGSAGWVVKFDGLALGKGVIVCGDAETALAGLAQLPEGRYVIEERLAGEEISWLAFCDGERCALLEPARDHKRLMDGDRGPNTGGMGAFSPVPGIPAAWADRVRNEVFLPTLREMKKRGTPFFGLLYAGLMVDVVRDRFWVLEFNARFGDPETQALMLRMEGDLFDWCLASAKRDLSGLPPQVPFRRETAVAVVAAAKGYPDAPVKGALISGPDSLLRAFGAPVSGDPEYFCAGVSRDGEGLKTAGGRVFAALGLGPDLGAARRQAYDRLFKVRFEGLQARADIGNSAAAAEGGER